MISSPKQIQVPKTLDVESIERELAMLWVKTAQDPDDQQEGAVLRARVANLLVFIPNRSKLDEINATLVELSPAHPCRALVVAVETDAAEHDIEMYISSFYRRGIDAETKDLCCEEVTLVAGGSFVAELPSATLPLLIPDLPVFLWWHDIFKLDDSLFESLCRGANRLIVDSVAFSPDGLSAIAQLCGPRDHMRLGISDINWERLTFWRGLLASFYDVPQYRIALDALSAIEVDYSAPESSAQMIAPQAMLIAGWLASRLGWQPVFESSEITDEGLQIDLKSGNAEMRLKLNKVERIDLKPGRLARVELRSDGESTAFVVRRNENGLHLEAYTNVAGEIKPGQLLPVRNRSTAQLVGREMEILVNDEVYSEAVLMGIKLIS
jgi:glucose-6-phosphate dehydrogenase assembly protein OpcA